jgi:hypothetical protein
MGVPEIKGDQMKKNLLLLLEWICKGICLLLLVNFCFFDVPIMTGHLIVDAKDPDHPIYLMGVGSSILSVTAEVALIVATFLVARFLVRSRQRAARDLYHS